MDGLPDTFWTALRLVGGFTMFCIGVSFAWKCFKAAFLGQVSYWSGLEKFGWWFFPITYFISPMLTHLPYDKDNSLIQEKQQLWVHLFFGPVFFVVALMFMTSGADLMGLPGSVSLNTVLTLNRTDVPPCIVYSPPFNYRFPFVKKAARTVIKALTIKIPENKKDSLNAYERKGDDTSQYSKFGPDWFYEDDEEKEAEARREAAAQAAASKK